MNRFDPGDPPEEPEYLGCPVCHTPSEDTWVDVPNTDPKFPELIDPYRCKNCGVYFDFAMKHFDKLFNALESKLEPPEPDYEPDCELSPEAHKDIQRLNEEADRQRMIEYGWVTEDGELTDAYYRAADIAYDSRK